MSTYALILLLSGLFPFLLSFDKKVRFYTLFPKLIPAILLPAILFLVWDVWFTGLGVWSFNPVHTGSWKIINLPLEEVLFFVVIPYASLFTYEVVRVWLGWKLSAKNSFMLSLLLSIVLIISGLIFIDRMYSSVNFLLSGILILFLGVIFRKPFMQDFYPAFLVILIPFLIVNGLLTGTGLSEPVVSYNDAENLGIRIVTIPFEDVFYGMSLLLMNTAILEWLRSRVNPVSDLLP